VPDAGVQGEQSLHDAGPERLFRELLPDQERILGPDHPDTLATRHDVQRLNKPSAFPDR
jgi:hypothetical protein